MEDRIERCAEKFAILFGAAPAGDEGTDPEFMKILQRFIFGEVCYTGQLSDEDRELVTVTALAVNQTLPQLKAHVGAALNAGCTPVVHPGGHLPVCPLHRIPQDPQRHRRHE